jgi:sulfite exporter TauE/SafE
VFSLKGSMLGFLTILVGIVMLVLGLQLTEIFPRITKGFTLPSGLAKKFGIKQRGEREYSNTNTFFMGAATFFLPCGFTQARQLLAVSTGSPIQGAIIMGAFALGTAPGLLSLGGLTSIIKGVFAQRFFRIVGLVVVMMALINLSNGYNLMGLSRYVENFTLPDTSQEATKQDTAGSNILNTTYRLNGDISPSTFTAKVGQKTTLLVDVQDNGQGCMSTIMIPGLYETPLYLSKGKKLALTFTPTSAGNYHITCAMGIGRGTLTVTN